VATALLLQAYYKVSDAEAKQRADFDIRWKVALGIEVEDRPFAKSTLQLFRAQLILHDRVRAIFQRSLQYNPAEAPLYGFRCGMTSWARISIKIKQSDWECNLFLSQMPFCVPSMV